MNINANELLLLSKKIKFAGVDNEPAKETGLANNIPQDAEEVKTGMNSLMFKGLNNLMSDPQLAQEVGVMNEIAQPEVEDNNAKEYVTPFKSNLAFQGKANQLKSLAVAAMLGLGGAAALTSCDKLERPYQIQSVDIDIDMSEYIAIMQEMLNEMRAMREDMAKYNEANAAKYDKIIDMITKCYELLLKQDLDNATFKTMVLENQEIMIDLMIENGYTQEEANKKLDSILDALNNQNLSIEELNKLIQEIKGLVSDIKGLLQQAIKDLQEYADRASKERQELIETNKQGFDELISQGKINGETLQRMEAQNDSLISLSNKQIEAQENIKKAIEQANLDSNANFETVIKTLNVNKNELINVMMRLGYTQAQIQKMTAAEIIKAIDNNTEITKQGNALLARITKQLMILPELYKNGKITNAKLQEFYNLYQQAIAAGGEFTQEMLDKLDKLASELENIEGILNDMNTTLKGMSENFNKFYQDYSDNKKTEFKMLGQIYQNGRFQSQVLVNMAKTQDDMAENLEGIKANTDSLLVIAQDDTRFNELINTIKDAQNGNNTSIDYNRLEQMFKLLNMNLSNVIGMSSYQLQQAIKDFQNTYIKMEEKQLEEIRSVQIKMDDLQIFLVNNKDQNNQGIIDAINGVTDAVNSGKEDVTNELHKIQEQLDALQTAVNAILKSAGEQAGKTDYYFQQWNTKFQAALDKLDNFENYLSIITANQSIANKRLANLITEVKNLKAEIIKLQEMAGGSNISMEELEEMWKKHDAENYAKYSELLKDLGLNQGGNIDFTTIEGLLNSIDEKMDNINDYSDILNQILDKLNNLDKNNPDYTNQLNEIKEILKNFKCNCECGGNNEGILGDLDKILG